MITLNGTVTIIILISIILLVDLLILVEKGKMAAVPVRVKRRGR